MNNDICPDDMNPAASQHVQPTGESMPGGTKRRIKAHNFRRQQSERQDKRPVTERKIKIITYLIRKPRTSLADTVDLSEGLVIMKDRSRPNKRDGRVPLYANAG